jgi:hypothetical protein
MERILQSREYLSLRGLEGQELVSLEIVDTYENALNVVLHLSESEVNCEHLTSKQAKNLAAGLIELADEIESKSKKKSKTQQRENAEV